MGHFLNTLRLEDTGKVVNGRTIYRLLEAVVFEIGTWRIIVPAGYQYDGASVPRILWSIFEPMGQHAKPAAIHDWLYATGFSRWMADAIFYEALLAIREPHWKSMLAWLVVRWFGESHYKSRHQRSELCKD